MQLQMQQDRSTMMALQLLRDRAAADAPDASSARQQLAESQALVLELQMEQVFFDAISCYCKPLMTLQRRMKASQQQQAELLHVARCSITDLTV
jgi:hypothetical protein